MNEPRDQRDIERLEELARFPDENPNPVLRVSPEGSVLYANEAARQTRGLLGGRKHEKLAKDLLQNLAAAVADKTVHNVEFEASGTTYNFALAPVAGRPYINVFGSNVTQLKQMEKAARASEELLATILEYSPMHVALRDGEGKFLLINRSYEEVHGVAKDNVVGKTLHEIFPEEMADIISKGDSEVMATGEFYVNEETHVRDDREIVFSAVKFPTFDLSGNVTGVGIIDVDVTESKRAEELLARQEFEARLLLRVTEMTTNTKSRADALKQALQTICETLDWPMGHVYRVEDDGQQLISTDFWHLDDPESHAAFKEITESTNFARGEGLPGRILESGEPAWITNVQTDPNFPRAKHAVDIGVKGAFGFPVKMDGRTVAVLEFFSDEELSPNDSLLAIMGKVGVEIGRVFRRRDAELQLQEKEAQLRIALENIPGALVYTDEALNIVICNDRFADIYQAPKELLEPGKPYPDFLRYLAQHGYYGEGDVEKLVAQRVESLRNPTDQPFVDHLPDGGIHEVRRRAAKGGTVTVITDITERKRAEEALDRERQILNLTLESIGQGISMFDDELRLTSFNDKFLEILDLPADRIKIGTSLEEAFRFNAERGDYGSGDIEEQVRERIELARKFEPHLFERTRPDGTVLEVRGTPAQGGGFVTTYTDITERKRAERELAETEAQMRMALETLPGGLVYTDDELNVVVANEKFAEMHNAPKELLESGRPYTGFLKFLAEHGYYGEGDVDAFVAQRVEVIRNPTDTTLDHRTPEGRIHEIRRRRVAGGGTVTVVTDVTEEKQAAEEISRQARMLMEMSTPVTQMWPGTLLLPLVGMIDTKRAHDILNAVLERISATRAKVLILDISGVSVVDSAVANHLIQITKATKLMGCHCVISGVSSAVAQTIVELGIDVEEVETTANLAQAIRDREFSLA